jgi:hypothetical protein
VQKQGERGARTVETPGCFPLRMTGVICRSYEKYLHYYDLYSYHAGVSNHENSGLTDFENENAKHPAKREGDWWQEFERELEEAGNCIQS